MVQFQDKKILIVDDEPQMRELLRAYLEKSHFIVEEANNGQDALDKLSVSEFDCIVLDVMMPEMDGLMTCLEIRKSSEVPIIMLTARGDELDRVHGLELGADDYIVKPFSPRELVARIKALLRRSQVTNKSESELLMKSFGAISIDEKARRVKVQEKELVLTPKEYDLLLFLTKNQNQVWTREQILEHVWGYDFYGSLRTVDTHIKTLRMKLGDLSNYISTIWGVGYKFEIY
ncbi:response regulator transcription factor [Tepidibacillus infernus]|uniref:response regulator transcription factor n=1 Tax=Tepidibacillus infernus TaxID=1806172 RepID=UPI003B697F70